jgi:hypothetical protein
MLSLEEDEGALVEASDFAESLPPLPQALRASGSTAEAARTTAVRRIRIRVLMVFLLLLVRRVPPVDGEVKSVRGLPTDRRTTPNAGENSRWFAFSFSLSVTWGIRFRKPGGLAVCRIG